MKHGYDIIGVYPSAYSQKKWEKEHRNQHQIPNIYKSNYKTPNKNDMCECVKQQRKTDRIKIGLVFGFQL